MNKTISGRTEVNVTTTIEVCFQCGGNGIRVVPHSWTNSACPYCNGSGRIIKTISTATEIKAFGEETSLL
jgi:DnaJ-class molecular chaperone